MSWGKKKKTLCTQYVLIDVNPHYTMWKDQAAGRFHVFNLLHISVVDKMLFFQQIMLTFSFYTTKICSGILLELPNHCSSHKDP